MRPLTWALVGVLLVEVLWVAMPAGGSHAEQDNFKRVAEQGVS